MPNASRPLLILDAHSFITQLSLLLGLMQELLNEREQHKLIPIEQVLHLRQRHKLIVIVWQERSLDEVVLALHLDQLLELWEVILSQLEILDQLLRHLDMPRLIQASD